MKNITIIYLFAALSALCLGGYAYFGWPDFTLASGLLYMAVTLAAIVGWILRAAR